MNAALRMLISLMILTSGLTACGRLGGHRPMDGVEVRDERLAARLPARLPNVVYVADFVLDAASFSGDQGLRGAMPPRLPARLGQVSQGLPAPLATGNPTAAAARIVERMAADITQGLCDQGAPAQRLRAGSGPRPREGWMIAGQFTEVDEGNRIERATLGFGRGATAMEVQVGISDLGGADPDAPFALFGTVKDSNPLPGGAVSLIPSVMAAKFVIEKNATERDVDRTARQIVAELLKFRDAVRRTQGLPDQP